MAKHPISEAHLLVEAMERAALAKKLREAKPAPLKKGRPLSKVQAAVKEKRDAAIVEKAIRFLTEKGYSVFEPKDVAFFSHEESIGNGALETVRTDEAMEKLILHRDWAARAAIVAKLPAKVFRMEREDDPSHHSIKIRAILTVVRPP